MSRPMAFAVLCALALFVFPSPAASAADAGWRIRIRDAAVVGTVNAEEVRLGEIADAEGNVPADIWGQLAATVVMPAPAELGRPMSVSKAKLQPVLKQALGSYADLCIYPGNLAVQRGGGVVREAQLRQQVSRDLAGAFSALSGEVSLQDFRLPSYVFLGHPMQAIVLETAAIEPGRNSLRFSVMEGETLVRRFTGSVMVDVWVAVFCAARPLNRGETLDPLLVTTVRKNLAHITGPLWDGRGGPWMMVRAVGTGQPIFQADLAAVPLVRKGSVVTLRYQSNTVSLSVKAEAMSDGGAGDVIQVKNLESKRIIHATVVDGQTVVIQGPGDMR